MKKNILYMGLIFFVSFVINTNNVKAIDEAEVNQQILENDGIKCVYNFPEHSEYNYSSKTVRCYFYKSNRKKKDYNKNMCYFVNNDGKFQKKLDNYETNGSTSLASSLKGEYAVKDYINSNNKCPEYAVANYPHPGGAVYEIYLLSSKQKFEEFVKEGNINSKLYNAVCPGGCKINTDSSFGPLDNENNGGSVEEYDYTYTIVDPNYSEGCGIFGDKTLKRLKWTYKFIRIIAPILVVVFGIASFLGVVFSGEEKSLEEAKRNFINRLVAAIILILFPFLLEFLVNLLGLAGVETENLFCGILD